MGTTTNLDLEEIVKRLIAGKAIDGLVVSDQFNDMDILREGISALSKFKKKQINGIYENQDAHSYVKRALAEYIIIKQNEPEILGKIKKWRKIYGWQNDAFDYRDDAYQTGLLALLKFAKGKVAGTFRNPLVNFNTYLDEAMEDFMKYRKRILDGEEKGQDEACMALRKGPPGATDWTVDADDRCDGDMEADGIVNSSACSWARTHALKELGYTTDGIAEMLHSHPATIRSIFARKEAPEKRATWDDIKKACEDNTTLLIGVEFRVVELSYEYHHGQRLSNAEIARKMEMKPNTVHGYYSSAKHKLREVGLNIRDLPHKRVRVIAGK